MNHNSVLSRYNVGLATRFSSSQTQARIRKVDDETSTHTLDIRIDTCCFGYVSANILIKLFSTPSLL